MHPLRSHSLFQFTAAAAVVVVVAVVVNNDVFVCLLSLTMMMMMLLLVFLLPRCCAGASIHSTSVGRLLVCIRVYRTVCVSPVDDSQDWS